MRSSIRDVISSVGNSSCSSIGCQGITAHLKDYLSSPRPHDETDGRLIPGCVGVEVSRPRTGSAAAPILRGRTKLLATRRRSSAATLMSPSVLGV